MGVGAGIFLIALGAILRFAVTTDIEGLSIDMVGNILMIAGVAVAVLSLVFYVASPRRNRVVEERVYDDRVDVV